MYAVAFDLVVSDTDRNHPKGVSQAYADIGTILAKYGFHRVQGSLYVTENEDMGRLFMAIQALKFMSSKSPSPRTPKGAKKLSQK